MAVQGILAGFFDLISRSVNQLVVAAIILFIGLIAARLLGKLTERVLSELEVNKLLLQLARVDLALDEVAGSLVKYFIYFFAVIFSFSVLNVQFLFLDAAAALLAVVILLSILLSLKDFIPNVGAGFFLHQKGSVKRGDLVKVGDVSGRILSIDLFDAKIETDNSDILYVPNSYFVQNMVIVKRKKH